MSEDFIEYEEENESSSGSSNRTFLTLAGLLTLTLILMLACSAAFLFLGPSADRAEEIAAIETQNAVIAVTNAAVTRIISQTETAVAQPTDTPEATETTTPTIAPTDTPTATAVVQSIVETTEANETANAQETADSPDATSEILGTTVFDEADDGTPTPIADQAVGSSGSGSDAGSGSSGNAEETLPETGLGTFTGIVIAGILIFLFFGARRLRTN